MGDYLFTHLRLGLDYSLFIKPGDDNKTTKHTSLKDVIISYIAPLILLPYGIYTLYLTSHTDIGFLSGLAHFSAMPFDLFLVLTAIKEVVLLLLTLSLMYFICKATDRTERFFHYLVISNWTIFPITLISSPIFLFLLFGKHDDTSIYFLICLSILYGYAVSVFVLTYALKMPWELAFGIATLFLFIGETANKVVNLFGGVLTG